MSDSTVIQPAPGQTVVTTESHHGHHREGHPDNWDLSAQMQRDSNAIGNEVGRGFTAAALASCKTDDAICGLGQLVAGSAKESAIGFKDVQVQALTVENRGLLEAAKNFYALNVQSDKNFYALSVENVKNAASIAAQLAECCCELKMQITAEGVATRGLIETNEKARLQAEIVQLQARLLRVPPLPL